MWCPSTLDYWLYIPKLFQLSNPETWLSQVPAAVEDLMGCKWTAADVLPINGSEEDVEALREALLLTRAAAKAARISKKAKHSSGAAAAAVAAAAEAQPADSPDGDEPRPQKDLKQQKRALEVSRPLPLVLSIPANQLLKSE